MKKKYFIIFCLIALMSGASVYAASNQELRIGIDQEFETLNPIIHQMSASAYVGYAVTVPLISINADWEWACWLCVDVPTLENGKARVIEENGQKKILVDWAIKPEAKWGDGIPITGKDVVFSWEVGSSPNVAVGEKEVYTNIESITLDPADPKKFTMKVKARYDFANMGTFYIVSEHLDRPVWEKSKNVVGDYEKQTKYSTDSMNPGLYSGPYLVNEIALGSHVIMTPNSHFYGEKPKIQKLVFKLIPDSATLEANLISGTVDLLSELSFTLDQALAFEKKLAQNPALQQKFKVLYRDGPNYEHIDLNLRNPILQDVRVRQALLYAFDRDKLTQALFEGRQKKALHMIHPLDPYYTEDVPQYGHDSQKAKMLLDESGWKKSPDGFRYNEDQKLSLSFITTAGDKTRELVQVYLQGEWKKIGVDVVIKNEPARVFFGETVRKGKYPGMAMFTWAGSPDNPPLFMLHSTQIPTEKNGFSGQNSGAWVNQVVDENFDKVVMEFDFDKRMAMMKTIQQEYTREVPVIPLYNRAEVVVVPTSMKGFRISGTQFYSTLSAEQWSFE